MSRPALAVLCLGLGALIHPLCEVAAALLAHEHPWDRTHKRAT